MKAYLSIQCDAPCGTTGDFLSNMDGTIASPVFTDLVKFFIWAEQNGWEAAPRDPKYPVGVYQKGEG
jgi:hypothetical protein